MSPSTTGAATSRAGGIRGWVLLALVVLVGTVLLTVANLDRAGSTEPLHPQNPAEDGTRAVARVLEQQGVAVEVVDSDAELRGAAVDDGTTLVVTTTGQLGTSTYPALREASAAAATTVLLAPPAAVLDALGLRASTGSTIGGDLGAECDLPLLEGLTLSGGGTTYSVPDGTACFRAGPGAELPGLVASTGDTWLVGAPGALTNAAVRDADNAAVALRVLGRHPRVVWYDATADDLLPGDIRADAGTLDQVLPDWLRPSLLLLVVALLVALLWTGRRFGPLVVEPLPVVVRADEAEASRGRLYHAARDRGHAAEALRADARARLGARASLPPTASVDALCDDLARRPGSPDRATLRALLDDGPVADDPALVRLATDLARLLSTHPGKDRP